MHDDDEELFHHQVRPWTVGQLREALAGLPDDLPLVVHLAQEPGGQIVDEQVIVSAGFGIAVDLDGSEDIGRVLSIGCEFPTGDYYRRRR